MNLKINDTSHQSFLADLRTLLKECGITHSRLPIRADVKKKENKLSPSTEKSAQQVGRVILHIEERLTEELSLEELAEKAGLSKYQLIRRFREEEGITPWKYLIRKRIDKAKKLLAAGTPPGQVAAETGFYDQSHLNRIFREETGNTPKEYQQQNFINKN